MQLLYPRDVYTIHTNLSIVETTCSLKLFIVNIYSEKICEYTLCYVTIVTYMLVVSGWYYDQAKTIQCADMIFKIN